MARILRCTIDHDYRRPHRTGMTVATGLTLVVVVCFFTLLLLGAFASAFLATPIFGAVPLSFVLGWGFIIGVVLITAIYAWWANRVEAGR